MIDENGIITELTDFKPEYKHFAVSIIKFVAAILIVSSLCIHFYTLVCLIDRGLE